MFDFIDLEDAEPSCMTQLPSDGAADKGENVTQTGSTLCGARTGQMSLAASLEHAFSRNTLPSHVGAKWPRPFVFTQPILQKPLHWPGLTSSKLSGKLADPDDDADDETGEDAKTELDVKNQGSPGPSLQKSTAECDATKPSEPPFDGRWVGRDGTKVTIEGTRMMCEGDVDAVVSFDLVDDWWHIYWDHGDGDLYGGHYSASGCIVWDDGDVWNRVEEVAYRTGINHQTGLEFSPEPRTSDVAISHAVRYVVEHARVAVRDTNSTKGRVLAVVQQGTWVQGKPADDAAGVPWLQLDGETRGQLGLPSTEENAYMMVEGSSIGLGQLLRCVEANLVHRSHDGQHEELGETPLIAAVRRGDASAVATLLQQRAEVNAVDFFGETPLMEAASAEDAVICKLLLDHHADPTLRSPNGLTAQSLAAGSAELSLVFHESEFWRENRIAQLASDHIEESIENLLSGWESGGLSLARADADGNTALHLLAQRTPTSGAAGRIATLLVEAKAPVDGVNILGETPLIIAARCCDGVEVEQTWRLSVPRALIAANASVNASDSISQESPLMEAAIRSDFPFISLLLEARADPGRRSLNGQKAADFAGDARIIAALNGSPVAEADADADVSSESGHDSSGENVPDNSPVTNHHFSASLPKFAKNFQFRTVPILKAHVPKAPKAFQFRSTPLQAPPTSAVRGTAPVGKHRVQAKTVFFGGTPRPNRLGGFRSAAMPGGPRPPPSKTPMRPPPPWAGPSAGATGAATARERAKKVLQSYPGFTGKGLTLPPEAFSQGWTSPEMELYCGSMGELWPHGRPRANAKGSVGGRKRRPPDSVLRPHCERLGVPVTVKQIREVRVAYRKLALKYHPDKNPGSESAVATFQQLTASYDFLISVLDA